jgi:hypothetical protein
MRPGRLRPMRSSVSEPRSRSSVKPRRSGRLVCADETPRRRRRGLRWDDQPPRGTSHQTGRLRAARHATHGPSGPLTLALILPLRGVAGHPGTAADPFVTPAERAACESLQGGAAPGCRGPDAAPYGPRPGDRKGAELPGWHDRPGGFATRRNCGAALLLVRIGRCAVGDADQSAPRAQDAGKRRVRKEAHRGRHGRR